jgi:hypothetical protein
MQVISLRELGSILFRQFSTRYNVPLVAQSLSWALCKYSYAPTVANGGLFCHLCF